MFLHQLILVSATTWFTKSIHFPVCKVFHLFPQIPSCISSTPQGDDSWAIHGIRACRGQIDIEAEKLDRLCGICEFTNQHKGDPEVRMRVLLSKFLHCVSVCVCHVTGFHKFSVEMPHQQRSALIVDVPHGTNSLYQTAQLLPL